jgi:hypothetical protein
MQQIPRAVSCTEGFANVFRYLLAAVALQHVHGVDGNVVRTNFVLFHDRLLHTSRVNSLHTIYEE